MNIQVKILEVSGLEIAAQYVGLPVGKIRSRGEVHEREKPPIAPWVFWVLAQESLLRLNRLIAKGDEHAKIMRQVTVHMEITAPRYWWQQFATYRAGVEMYSGSTMHTLLRDPPDFDVFVPGTAFSPGLAGALGSQDLRRAKANLPEGYLQTRLVMVSYQTLRRIWLQRRGHRLPEWHEFIEVLHTLPYCHDLILVEPYNPWRELWVEWFDFSGEPWERDDRGQWCLCFFCGSRDSHSPDCVYLKAKKLLDKEVT